MRNLRSLLNSQSQPLTSFYFMEDKMKKTISLMLALSFSAVMLLGEAINTTTKASEDAEAPKLCCNVLSGCGSDECCSGKGRVSGCVLLCDSGTGIVCPEAEGGGGGPTVE